MDRWRRLDAAMRRHRVLATLVTAAVVCGARLVQGAEGGAALAAAVATAAVAYLAMRWAERQR